MRPPDSCIHGQRCILCHMKLFCASLQVCKYKGEQYTLRLALSVASDSCWEVLDLPPPDQGDCCTQVRWCWELLGTKHLGF